MIHAPAAYYPPDAIEFADQPVAGASVAETVIASPHELFTIRNDVAMNDGDIRAIALTGEGWDFPGITLPDANDADQSNDSRQLIYGVGATLLRQAALEVGITVDEVPFVTESIDAQAAAVEPAQLATSGLKILAQNLREPQTMQWPQPGSYTLPARQSVAARLWAGARGLTTRDV